MAAPKKGRWFEGKITDLKPSAAEKPKRNQWFSIDIFGFWKWFPKFLVCLSFFTQESRFNKKTAVGFFQTGSANILYQNRAQTY